MVEKIVHVQIQKVYLTIIPWDRVGYEVINNQRARSAVLVMITSYPTRANGTIALVYSQIGFLPPIFISKILQSGQKSMQLPVTRAVITWLLHHWMSLMKFDSYTNDKHSLCARYMLCNDYVICALLHPVWNHWLSLQSDWLSTVRFIPKSHYFLH